MSGQAKGNDPQIIGNAMICGVALYGAIWVWPGPHGDFVMQGIGAGAALIGGIAGWNVAMGVMDWLERWWRFRRSMKPDSTHGTAGWLTEEEARQAGLQRRVNGARFLGVLGRTALWALTETTHLVIGPSGSSKTTSAIVNFLCSIRESALVSDTKGELFHVTALFRQKVFGHRIVVLDPTDPNSDQVNPIDPIHEQLEADDPDALALLTDMSLQMYPEPKTQDQNTFFREGTRIAITSMNAVVAAVCAPEMRTLSTVYSAFIDEALMHDLLEQAAACPLLDGRIAAMAEDLHKQAFGDGAEARTYEQFRIGVMQALSAYGPGGHLARVTARTTFDFADLKREKVTCYIIVDHNNKTAFGRWSGLMQFLAVQRIVRERNNAPVAFVLDEFCNSPLHALPSILTLLRSYGVRCILATQDLDDIVRVYGKHALETILSESDIKQFLGGIRSQTTLNWLEKYLGQFTADTSSFGLDGLAISETRGRTGRPILTADETRRMDLNWQIIIKSNLRPILARKVQVFAIAPWRRRIGINAMYGGKRFLKPVEVHVGRFRTKVRPRGEFHLEKSSTFWTTARYLIRSVGGHVLFGLVIGLGWLSWQYGTPYLRTHYALTNQLNAPTPYQWCRYSGLESLTRMGGPCPLIILKKDW